MRSLLVVVLAAVLLGVVPTVAGAQGLSTLGSQGRVVATSSQGLRVQGSVEVEFRGTTRAGCEALAVCDVSGSVSYTPGRRGELFLTTLRRADGSLRRDAQAFSFGFGPAAPQAIGSTRRGEQQCVDARSLDGGSYDVRVSGDDLRVSLAPAAQSGFFGGDLLRTRCAGPKSADVLAGLGAKRISLASLAGGRTVDFRADEPFSAGGFAGTVRSSVQLVLAPARRRVSRPPVRRPSRPRRARTTRQVQVPLRLVRVAGDATIDLAGDPVTCRRLDACGVTGAITATPRPTARRVFFSLGVRSRSRPAALAAVGLGTASSARVAFGGGGASLGADAGRVRTALDRAGLPICRARADVLSGGFLELQVVRATRRLRVSLTGSGLGHSRCQGPLASDLGTGDRSSPLASGSVPLSALRSRRLTVALTETSALVGPGYLGRTRSTLSVVLERGAVRLGG